VKPRDGRSAALASAPHDVGLLGQRPSDTPDEPPICSDEQAQATPRWLTWVTRISLVVGLVALVTTIWFVGPSVILGHLDAIGLFFIVIIGIDVLSSVCDATAVYFMAHGKAHPPWRKHVVAQLAGRGVNAVTPGGNLGEAVKVGLLSQRCSPRRIVAAIMFVTLMLVLVSLLFVAVGSAATAILFNVPRPLEILLFVGAGFALTVACGIYLLLRRGMLSTLTNLLASVRIVSKARREKWRNTLEEIDARLRGQHVEHRRKALVFILLSQCLQKSLTFLVVYAAGYTLSPAEYLAIVSAGVLLGWFSTIIPMGIGISEGGNVALFGLIGAPASLGLALALARRVNQVVFATIGFIVLTADQLGMRFGGQLRTRWLRPRRPREQAAEPATT
jgi:hypothetical protein